MYTDNIDTDNTEGGSTVRCRWTEGEYRVVLAHGGPELQQRWMQQIITGCRKFVFTYFSKLALKMIHTQRMHVREFLLFSDVNNLQYHVILKIYIWVTEPI